MLLFFASNEPIDRDWLLSQLKGDHARQCLDKIERMRGQIVAINFAHGQWPDTKGEMIWYEIGEPDNRGFAELRTDDSCVSWASMGRRWADRPALIAEVTATHEEWHLMDMEQSSRANSLANTNLVGSSSN